MKPAGFCRECGANVWLDDRWSCPSGHGWDKVSGWYDGDTGQPITPPWEQVPATQPEPAASAPEPEAAVETPRLALLADVLTTFAQYPGYTAQYGTDTDIIIDNQVALANWGTGKKKVEYSAAMKAVETDRTLIFWEILKEKGGGLSFGGFESEVTTTFGTKRSGKTSEKILGPNGVAMDYKWDYAATRRIVEEVATRHGWQVKVVLRKGSAQW
ncbi:MAG: hypothetical protein U1E22_01790 [Coriobacteriia bacterium]|nr:hypothetical protein [Coriobacteriia bacterium]